MLREDMDFLKETLTEETVMTRREFLLAAAVCIFGGMILGMLLSPRKYVMIGSNNGNGSCNNSGNDKERQTGGKEKCKK